ncbi:MAG TPA: serine/threonine-protein kinase, partial [Aggregatilineales bacterium]|nr:serine/threonine-protein kinase [Aggregatilineales bacterium]
MAHGDPFYIGSYRTTREIGEGAFGLVYQAYQPFLDRQVAVKTLHTDLSAEPRIEQQFMHEARTIARLRHPNIVSVYEFGTAEIRSKASTYMVMEYLPGETLQSALKRGPIPVADVVNIVEQLGKALDYAHERDVIHRDLKPANIMFTEQKQPVIVDFGLAKLMALSGFSQGNGGKSALESSMSGTPAYMSPEQVANESVGPASDQYSLATIAYEML